jgi:hypothetical protein
MVASLGRFGAVSRPLSESRSAARTLAVSIDACPCLPMILLPQFGANIWLPGIPSKPPHFLRQIPADCTKPLLLLDWRLPSQRSRTTGTPHAVAGPEGTIDRGRNRTHRKRTERFDRKYLRSRSRPYPIHIQQTHHFRLQPSDFRLQTSDFRLEVSPRRQTDAPNRPLLDVCSFDSHRPMLHGLPVTEKVVVVGRLWMSRLPDRVDEAAVVGR